jgi:hypothetical protein
MPDNIDDLIQRIQQKHLSDQQPRQPGFKGKLAGWLSKIGEAIAGFLTAHKGLILIGMGCLLVLLIGFYFLTKDYLTKRQNYPERNVLFRATNVVYVAGGSEEKGPTEADQASETDFYEGGVESKVGTYLFRTVRDILNDIEYFNLDNSQKIRIASASSKPEIVQAGLRIRGSLNFKEQFAQIILSGESKAPQSYRVYRFEPERGLKEVEVTVLEHADRTTALDNRMTELRTFGIGWLWGKEFRAGTLLAQYPRNQQDNPLIKRFYEHIKALDSQKTAEPAAREQMIKAAIATDEAIETTPIYASYEDGIFDLLPQESTIYLAYRPGLLERIKDTLLGKSDHIRLRIENYYDLFPGWYPLLRNFHVGKGENIIYPFDKYNNGGYLVKDQYGELAKIDIHDFFLYYGQDVLYRYYFDLNGDGKLDQNTELIGQVLCRTTHDERMNLEKLVGIGRPKADVTFTIHYSFMAPDADLQKGLEYFNLCEYIESLMPDQINRGYGKHSFLGYINEHRSDIMLFKHLTVENMSRSLTKESTLVARDDIVKALIAAKRPYAQQVAETYGIADQFAGQFQPSTQLVERRDWSWPGGIFLTLMVLGGSAYWIRRRRKQKATS